MSFFRLLLRNLLYHWRGNFAVLCGIILGSAVLTGALLVGDSLRGSLQSLSLEQLGWVDNALAPGRFFRAALADELGIEKRSAVLLLHGGASQPNAPPVGRVTVLGIHASFWPSGQMPEEASFWTSEERGVVLNQTLATALEAKVGDAVILRLERADAAPPETLLAHARLRPSLSRFASSSNAHHSRRRPGGVYAEDVADSAAHAFVPIRMLQRYLDLAGRVTSCSRRARRRACKAN